MRSFNALIEKKLSQVGKKYIARDTVTIGDIAIFMIYSSHCVKENTLRPKHQEACAKSLSEFPLVSKWIDAMKEELAEHLAKRPMTVA